MYKSLLEIIETIYEQPFADELNDSEIDIEFLNKVEENIATTWFRKPLPDVDRQFKGFAQDGTGSYFAIWLYDNRDWKESPIVCFGSEGETGVIASNIGGFMALIALGHDPYALLHHEAGKVKPLKKMLKWVEENFKVEIPKDALKAVKNAIAGAPDFEEFLNDINHKEEHRDEKPAKETTARSPQCDIYFNQLPVAIDKLNNAKTLDDIYSLNLSGDYDRYDEPELLTAILWAFERVPEKKDSYMDYERIAEMIRGNYTKEEFGPPASDSFKRKPNKLTLELVGYLNNRIELLQKAISSGNVGILKTEVSENLKDYKSYEKENSGDGVADDTDADEDAFEIKDWFVFMNDLVDIHYQDLNRDAFKYILKKCPQVKVIKAQGIDEDVIKSLPKLKSLETLYLEITEHTSSTYNRLQSLKPIANMMGGVATNYLHNRNLELIGTFVNLKELSIHVSDIRDDGFAYLKNLKNLEKLVIAGNSEILGWGIQYLPNKMGLKELDFREIATNTNGLPKADFVNEKGRNVLLPKETFEAVSAFGNLESLSFQINEIDKTAFGAIAQLKLPKLKSLSCGGTNIDDKCLAFLEHGSDLEDLSGFMTKVKSLSYLSGHKKLSRLGLANTQVDDNAMKIIAGLENLKNLNISSTKVSDEGIALLTGLKKLTSLQLGSKQITEKSVEHLLKMKGLKELRLTKNTQISDKGKKAIEKALGLEISKAY
ncbi:MAG: F-box/LRR-repeat protein 14 [Bacteroidota bacterium]|nr:F-box/LRR-repeat protein 14 [Bacteroidota bacterium]